MAFVGDGDFRQIGIDGRKKRKRGGLLQHAAVDQQQPGDLPDFLLHPWQTRERMAETGGHPPRQPPHQPVRERRGQLLSLDRRQQRASARLANRRNGSAWADGWRIGRTDIHRVLCRHPNVG